MTWSKSALGHHNIHQEIISKRRDVIYIYLIDKNKLQKNRSIIKVTLATLVSIRNHFNQSVELEHYQEIKSKRGDVIYLSY